MKKGHSYLWSSLENGVESEIPYVLVVHLWEVRGNLDIDSFCRGGDVVGNLNLFVEFDGIEVANGVIVQPNAVLSSRVLGQRVAAVSSWLPVEAQVNGLALGHGGVIGDALVDVQTGVVTLAPGYVESVSIKGVGYEWFRTYADSCRMQQLRWQPGKR